MEDRGTEIQPPGGKGRGGRRGDKPGQKLLPSSLCAGRAVLVGTGHRQATGCHSAAHSKAASQA